MLKSDTLSTALETVELLHLRRMQLSSRVTRTYPLYEAPPKRSPRIICNQAKSRTAKIACQKGELYLKTGRGLPFPTVNNINVTTLFYDKL